MALLTRKGAEAEVRAWGFSHVFTWKDEPYASLPPPLSSPFPEPLHVSLTCLPMTRACIANPQAQFQLQRHKAGQQKSWAGYAEGRHTRDPLNLSMMSTLEGLQMQKRQSSKL